MVYAMMKSHAVRKVNLAWHGTAGSRFATDYGEELSDKIEDVGNRVHVEHIKKYGKDFSGLKSINPDRWAEWQRLDKECSRRIASIISLGKTEMELELDLLKEVINQRNLSSYVSASELRDKTPAVVTKWHKDTVIKVLAEYGDSENTFRRLRGRKAKVTAESETP